MAQDMHRLFATALLIVVCAVTTIRPLSAQEPVVNASTSHPVISMAALQRHSGFNPTITNISTAWSQPLLIAANGHIPKIAIDTDGYEHVIWSTDAGISYANNRSGSWSAPMVLVTNSTAGTSYISAGIKNTVHVVYGIYTDTENSDSYIMYQQYSPPVGWSNAKVVATGYRLAGPTIAVDHAGSVHLAYIQGWNTSGAHVFYARQNVDGSWNQSERITTDIDANWNYFPSIAVDSANQPAVAWWGNPYQKYSQKINGQWSQATTIGDSYIYLGNDPNLVINSENTTFSLGHNIWDAMYLCAKPINQSWSCQKLPESPSYLGVLLNQPSLAFDQFGRLYAVWDGLSLAVRNSDGDWLPPSVIANGSNPTIAVDPSSYVHNVFEKNGQIFYLTNKTQATPMYSTSYYLAKNDTGGVFNLGCQQGQRDADIPGTQDNVVILMFGQPIVRSGNDTGSQYGAFLYGSYILGLCRKSGH